MNEIDPPFMSRSKCNKKSRDLSIILTSILFFSVVFVIFYKLETDSLFNKLSKEDRLAIEPLLKDLVLNNHFGYVLAGEKPVAFTAYFQQMRFENVLFIKNFRSINVEQSWKALEKIRSKLNSENFLLTKKEYNFFDFKGSNQECVDIVNVITIINKKLFLCTVQEHLACFKKALGDWVTPEKLLLKVSESTISLFEVLDKNEGLFGILLGYGKNNAFAFKRYLELAHCVDPLFYEAAPFCSLQTIKPSLGFSCLEEEYAYFQEQLLLFDLQFPFSVFLPPAFRVLKDDEETSILKEKYRKAHRRLMKTYQGKDFLEVTLKQFIAD